MPTLDAQIDDLYKVPLGDFVSARNALAKTLKGDEAKRVKALTKPTVVPWAVNQVYWHARDIYDRLTQGGEKLRKAQVTALGGHAADVRTANDTHRRAVAEAVAAATRIASQTGVHPSPEALTRMFESLSLASKSSESSGRFTEVLQPAGFEALQGVTVKATPSAPHVHPAAETSDHPSPRDLRAQRLAEEETRKREREEAAAEREKKAAIEKAEGAVTRAKKIEAQAREKWEAAQEQREEAERELRSLRGRS